MSKVSNIAISVAAIAATALGVLGATAASAVPAPARFTGQDLGAAAYQVSAGGAAYTTSFQLKYWRYDTKVPASGTTTLKVSGRYATVSPASLYLPQQVKGAPVKKSATVKISVPAYAPPGTYTDTVTATESNSQPVKFTFKVEVPPETLAEQVSIWGQGGGYGSESNQQMYNLSYYYPVSAAGYEPGDGTNMVTKEFESSLTLIL